MYYKAEGPHIDISLVSSWEAQYSKMLWRNLALKFDLDNVSYQLWIAKEKSQEVQLYNQTNQ